jgi:hypothetical protein
LNPYSLALLLSSGRVLTTYDSPWSHGAWIGEAPLDPAAGEVLDYWDRQQNDPP